MTTKLTFIAFIQFICTTCIAQVSNFTGIVPEASSAVSPFEMAGASGLAQLPQLPHDQEDDMPEAAPFSATCFCKISCTDQTGLVTATNVCLDLTPVVNTTYGGFHPQSDANVHNCSLICPDKANHLTAAQLQTLANCFCSLGCGNNASIRAYSAVGTGKYDAAQTIGHLEEQSAVTTCRCPAGWLANITNVDGGVTTDHKCKKAACGPISIPNTQGDIPVGNWGFLYGNELWAWGTTANGGAPICTVTTPAVCRIVNP